MEALVVAAGTALIGAMATDTWQRARDSAVSLWRRVRPEEAPAVEAELAEVRDEVLAAREAEDDAAVEGLAADWQRKLRRLLQEDPELAVELRRILDEEWAPALPPAEQARVASVSMRVTASGNARVNMAGRDLRINDS